MPKFAVYVEVGERETRERERERETDLSSFGGNVSAAVM